MAIIEGEISGNKAEVDANKQIKVALATTDSQTGKVRIMSENDGGTITGNADLLSPETDFDFRLRVAADNLLDFDRFISAAQNTGKHNLGTSTLAAAWATGGVTFNSGASTATGSARLRTYAHFPLNGSLPLYIEHSWSFDTDYLATNHSHDFGVFADAAANPFTPVDGVYFRVNSSGFFGVSCFNSVETTTSAFSFTPTATTVYRFIITVADGQVKFWINGALYGTITTPAGQTSPFSYAALPLAARVANTSTSSAANSPVLREWRVLVGGQQYADTFSAIGNRVFGSYQGLSGSTMGSLASYANSANPTAAVPTNTTAALGTGLGGQFWETASLAVNTDGIICSYQVPAAATNVYGKRLVVRGVWLQSYIQTVIAGGPFVAQFSLAFGHTAVSLATAEAATTKAPRRVPLPALTQLVTAAQAVSTMVAQPGGSYMGFSNPIYVNPGEFIALVTKHVGTVGTTGTIAHVVAFDYGWE